jgi:hypothetical protein
MPDLSNELIDIELAARGEEVRDSIINALQKLNRAVDPEGSHTETIMDDTPTAGSQNTVKSGGIYSALRGKQDDLTLVPTVLSLLETDYLFLEREGVIYKILASKVMIASGGDGIETESGDALLTEDGQEILPDTVEEESAASST